MSSGRGVLVLMRSLWSVALVATLYLFALALAALVPAPRSGDIGASLFANAAGELRLSVLRGGGAAGAGIYEGDVLVAVNDIPVSTLEQAQALLNRAVGGSVTLTIRTGNFGERRVTVVPSTDSRRVLGILGVSGETSAVLELTANILFALACVATALIIAWKKWDDWFALLVSLTIVVVLVGASLPVNLFLQTAQGAQFPAGAWQLLAVDLLLAFFFLFPTGRFVPRPVRWVLAGLAVWLLLGLVNPVIYPWEWEPWQYIPLYVALIGTGVSAQVYRFRASAAVQERQQIRWVLFGAVAAVVGLLLHLLPGPLGVTESDAFDLVYNFVLYPLGFLLQLLLPLSIGIAILRYRLWDIDLVVNRTLVYGTLTLSVIGVYVVGVGVLGAVFHTANNLVVSLVMTGIVAVLFQPLRERLQRGVNHLMFGQRDEPYTVVAQLGKRVETTATADALLPTLVETIAQALKLPYVAIETTTDGRDGPAAAYGHLSQNSLRLPMQYQSETVGYLVVAPRRPDEPLSAADLNLLATIAQQTGTTVHAVRLTADLQRSREHLVMAREEERRRIRRDLHDGLGPALATLAMEADTARELAHTDATRTEALLADVTTRAQSAIQDVRRLVYNLRPPALDELGLVGALKQHVAALPGHLETTLDVPAEMPGLPAAVEVAAYRIAQEALNNVVRHADARHCTLRVTLHHGLCVEIRDDGKGISAGAPSGVGLISMRERAAELGGTCVIESVPDSGTRVLACIPLSR